MQKKIAIEIEDEPQAATSGRGLQSWRLPRGRNINIHPFVGPAKGVKKGGGVSTHQQRQVSTVCVDAVFHRNWTLYSFYYRKSVWSLNHILHKCNIHTVDIHPNG